MSACSEFPHTSKSRRHLLYLEQIWIPAEINDVEELNERVHVYPEDAVVELRSVSRVEVQSLLQFGSPTTTIVSRISIEESDKKANGDR